jgi:hypothetical protein
MVCEDLDSRPIEVVYSHLQGISQLPILDHVLSNLPHVSSIILMHKQLHFCVASKHTRVPFLRHHYKPQSLRFLMGMTTHG